MNALVLYRTNTEAERLVIDFARDFQRQTGKELHLLEADSPEGMELARLYDVVDYPTILARADDGSLLQMWQGPVLPRISEVSFYVQN